MRDAICDCESSGSGKKRGTWPGRPFRGVETACGCVKIRGVECGAFDLSGLKECMLVLLAAGWYTSASIGAS